MDSYYKALYADTILFRDIKRLDLENYHKHVTRYEKTDNLAKLRNLQDRAQNSAKSTSVEIFLLSLHETVILYLQARFCANLTFDG